MKLFKTHKKLAVSSLALVVAIMAGGAAFAYFTSHGSGTGNAYVGSGANLSISQVTPTSQVIYDSLVSPMPPDTWNEAFSELNTSFGPASIGNAVTLASSGTTLSSVVVALDNWACQTGTGNGPTCVTTSPGARYPATMTLNVYDPSNLGSAIAGDTQTFNIPFRPSASATCAVGAGNTWAGAGYADDGSQWYDAATNTCNYGQTSTVTFNNFGGAVLPSNVVYKISYTPNSQSLTDPSNYLNVVLSTESTDVSVGSDTDPGNLYLDVPTDGSGAAAAGPSGQVSCTPATAGFVEYSTASDSGCGLGTTFNIPAVEFNATAPAGGYIDLVPGGPAQPVDFKITNSSPTSAYVHSVTFGIGSITGTSNTCLPGWFSLVQPTVPVDVTIPGNSSVTYQPSGALIALINEPVNQDGCEGGTVNLTFSST
jgi:hypothetical protein